MNKDNRGQSFIKFAMQHEALQLGDFVLKSGRRSKYFFNLGKMNTGKALQRLGKLYADKLFQSGIEFDGVFGPAYKGISLAAITATHLYQDHGKEVCFSSDRKEAKDHGEQGSILGAPLTGRIVIVDDVLTAGTAVRKAIELILAAQAKPVALIVAMDREEKGFGEQFAAKELHKEYEIDVLSLSKASDLSKYLEENKCFDELEQMHL